MVLSDDLHDHGTRLLRNWNIHVISLWHRLPLTSTGAALGALVMRQVIRFVS